MSRWCDEGRACALHCAVSLYTGLRAEQTPDDAKNVLELAAAFEKWLRGGEEDDDGEAEENEDGQ